MIAPEIVNEIRRLLAGENLSHRKIAAIVGVSRGTVGAIDSGTRPDYDAMLHEIGDGVDEPAGPPERCPGCGGLVYMHCILCKVRNHVIGKPKQTFRGLNADRFEPLDMNLRPEHRSRYEEVLALRREQADCFVNSPLPLGEGQGARAVRKVVSG
jgi:hypothetical protein